MIIAVASALAGGRHQPFYHVLVDIGSRPNQSTYVAQENIERFADMPLARMGSPSAINHPEVPAAIPSSSAVHAVLDASSSFEVLLVDIVKYGV